MREHRRIMTIQLKRAYEPAERGDGVRVLVDRLWPRGVKKAAVDLWLKEVAPSAALRTWFGHKPERFAAFRIQYRGELARNGAAVQELRKAVRGKAATLLYGARDTEHNQAIVLAEYLKTRRRKKAVVTKKKTKKAAR